MKLDLEELERKLAKQEGIRRKRKRKKMLVSGKSVFGLQRMMRQKSKY